MAADPTTLCYAALRASRDPQCARNNFSYHQRLGIDRNLKERVSLKTNLLPIPLDRWQRVAARSSFGFGEESLKLSVSSASKTKNNNSLNISYLNIRQSILQEPQSPMHSFLAPLPNEQRAKHGYIKVGSDLELFVYPPRCFFFLKKF